MMKKILFIIGLLLLPAVLFAGQGMGPGPGVNGYAAASCTTLVDSDTSTVTADNEVGYQAAQTHLATRFTASENYTLCALEVYVKKVVTDGSPAYITRAELWTNVTGTAPDTLLATSTDTKGASDASTSYGDLRFAFSGQSLTSGSVYWIDLHFTTLGDFGDFLYWGVGSNFSSRATGDATPSWTNVGSGRLRFKTYK